MNINSSSYYSVSASSSSNGFTGLASGIDTESMVEQMLSGTQSKIDAQEALKQQTLWKQDIYREIITAINDFRDKYFDTSYDSSLSTNFANDDFFNNMISSIEKGSAVSIVGTDSSALTGDMSVIVKQLASNAKLEGEMGSLSGDRMIVGSKIDDDILKNFKKVVSLEIKTDTGTEEVTIDLSKVTDENSMKTAFEDALKDSGVSVSLNGGKLSFSSAEGTQISIGEGSSALGLQMAGLSESSKGSNTLEGTEIDLDASFSFTFNMTLDGIQKSITINELLDNNGNVTTDVTAETIKNAVAAGVKKAFGDYVTVGLKDDSLTFKVTADEPGHQLTITGVDANNFGIKPGATTQLSMMSTLSEMGLNGDRFSFTINGTEFTFTGDQTISTVINQINSSDAGVRISYSSIADNFTIEASSSGKGYGIEMSQQEGNLLTKMFGASVIENSSVATSNSVSFTTGDLTADTYFGDDYAATTASLKLNVNGKDYTFTLEKKEDDGTYSQTEVITELNKWLEDTFGVGDDGSANISYVYNAENKTGTLKTQPGYAVTISKTDANVLDADGNVDDALAEKAAESDLGVALGFAVEGASNVATDETKLSDIEELKDIASKFSKDGVLTENLTLADLKGEGVKLSLKDSTGGFVDVDVTYYDGRLTIANTTEKTFNVSDNSGLEVFFSSESISFGDGTFSSDKVQAGTDAVVVINGIETTRTSNSFTIDGVSMELQDVSKTLEDGSYEETVISTERDVDKIVEGFKSFVEDYNALIEKLNGYVNEDADYKEYAPLTSEQKKEMSENEIELWEEKAKTGLIRYDDSVETFLSQMRLALYTKPDGAKFALYDIGIETGDYKENGQLHIDETALRNAIISDPAAVQQLFLDSEQGLSAKLMDIIDYTAKETGGTSAGILVQLAGVKGTSSEKSNTLYDKLQDIEDKIEQLQYKYELEKTRYWNQFNSMETILSNYNTQSMWLSQQFS